jgi:hypothetical protein
MRARFALLLLIGLCVGAPSHAQTTATITGTPPTSVAAGQTYLFTPTVTVPYGQSYSLSISNMPAWATFDPATGRLAGTPTPMNAGIHANIRIELRTAQSLLALPTFSIEVVAGNAPPVIDGTPANSVTVGKTYSFTPSATDPDGQALSFSVVNKPVWASFSSSTGRLWGSPGSGRIGVYPNIVITVSDGQAATSLPPFSIAVLAANAPPVIGGVPADSATVGKSYSFTPTASDAEGDALTFSITNKPVWASFSSATGRLWGSPGSGRIGTYSNIMISVSDGQASAALPPFSIAVVGANSPPTIEGVPPVDAMAGQSYAFTPTASDPEGQPLNFWISGKPAWADFDPATGSLSGTPTTMDIGPWSGIVISASDGQASSALPAFTITVDGNRPPTISGTPPWSVTVGKTYSFRPTVSDAEGDSLKFSIVNKPVWATFVSSTGRIYGSPGSGRIGTYRGIRISVTDGQTTVSLPEFSIAVNAAGTTGTGSATVSWRPPASYLDGTPLTDLAGYLVLYGLSPSELSYSVEIPSPLITSAVIEALPPGVWYFAVKAYTAANVESDLSAVAYKIIN